MADQLLSAVIQLENQIQQQIQQEQALADLWLARVRNAQEKCINRAQQELATEDERLLAAADQKTGAEAAALIAAEKKYCTRLEQIRDQTLLPVLRRQLHKILPGQVDDYPDVKS